MNGLQMIEIEMAGGNAFDNALCGQAPLYPVKLFRVCYPEMVPEDMSSRIDIRVVQTHKVFEMI